MRFVWVNDRVPRISSKCAQCGASLKTGYLRDVSSRLPYCGYECYPGSDGLASAGIPQNPGFVGSRAATTGTTSRSEDSFEDKLIADLSAGGFLSDIRSLW
jgi:hypothetical protein